MNTGIPLLRTVVNGFGGCAALRHMVRSPSQIALTDNGVSRVRAQFGVRRVDEILSVSTLDPYVVALHDHDRELDQRHFIETEVGDGQIIRRTLRSDALIDDVRRGLTLTINGVDRFDGAAMRNREFLEYAAGAIAWCNVYVSRSTMSPFDTHTDNHHVIAVQGEGRKHWTVLDPTTGQTVFDDWLRTGQALFVPAHWPHLVRGGEEVSVHWTFGMSLKTGPYRELEDTVAAAASGGCIDTAQSTLTTYLNSEEMRRSADLLRRRTGASLAYHLLDTCRIPLEDITVRFGSRLPPVLGVFDTAVLVVAAGELHRVDRRLLPFLDQLAVGVDVSACALAAAVREKAARTFIEWGIGNGLLIADVSGSEDP